MARKSVESAVIHPRDYGLIVPVPGTESFESPRNYALGQIIRSSPAFLESGLQKRNPLTGLPMQTLFAISEAVYAELGAKVLVHMSGKEAIPEVQLQDGLLSGKVKSSSPTTGRFHEPSVTVDRSNRYGFSHIDAYCDCNDVKSTKGKHRRARPDKLRKMYTDKHLAALMTEAMVQGIEGSPRLPFRFHIESDGEMQQLVTAVLDARYQLKEPRAPNLEQKFYAISKALLEREEVYGNLQDGTAHTFRGILQGAIRFGVLRQKRMTTTKHIGYHNAMRNAEDAMLTQLKERGYFWSQYTIAFRETPFETVAHRLVRNPDEVALVTTSPDYAPVMVHVTDFIGPEPGWLNYWSHNDAQMRISPLDLLKGETPMVDDATRQTGLARLHIPGKEGWNIPVESPMLDAAYKSMPSMWQAIERHASS